MPARLLSSPPARRPTSAEAEAIRVWAESRAQASRRVVLITVPFLTALIVTLTVAWWPGTAFLMMPFGVIVLWIWSRGLSVAPGAPAVSLDLGAPLREVSSRLVLSQKGSYRGYLLNHEPVLFPTHWPRTGGLVLAHVYVPSTATGIEVASVCQMPLVVQVDPLKSNVPSLSLTDDLARGRLLAQDVAFGRHP